MDLHIRTQNVKMKKNGRREQSKILMDFQATFGDFRPFVISLYLEVFNLFGFFVIAFKRLLTLTLSWVPFLLLNFL